MRKNIPTRKMCFSSVFIAILLEWFKLQELQRFAKLVHVMNWLWVVLMKIPRSTTAKQLTKEHWLELLRINVQGKHNSFFLHYFVKEGCFFGGCLGLQGMNWEIKFKDKWSEIVKEKKVMEDWLILIKGN